MVPKSAWLDAYREVDNHGVTNQNWAEVFNFLLLFARTQYHLGASAYATVALIEARLARMALSSPTIDKVLIGQHLPLQLAKEYISCRNLPVIGHTPSSAVRTLKRRWGGCCLQETTWSLCSLFSPLQPQPMMLLACCQQHRTAPLLFPQLTSRCCVVRCALLA